MRISLDAWFMGFAQQAALRGTCKRAQVGCAIALGNRLLSIGYVGSPAGDPHCLDVGCRIGPGGGCIRTRHAEVNALEWARYTTKQHSLEGCTAYVTLSPCIECAQELVDAGIKRVWYAKAYRLKAGLDLLEASGVPHGLLEYR